MENDPYETEKVDDLDYRFGQIIEELCILSDEELQKKSKEISKDSKDLLSAIEAFLKIRFKNRRIVLSLTISK